MPLSPALFILVLIFVVGWFAVGTQYNVRKGHDAMRWLQDGLPLIGEKTNLGWLGSSVVELKIRQAKPPFRQADILVVLEPRDVAPIWAAARLRGRRDLFIFRGILRAQPRQELEALDTSAWSTHGRQRQLKRDSWTSVPVSPPLVAYSPRPSAAACELLSLAALDGCPLVRLAVHRTEPNFEVEWRLDHLRQHSSYTVFETLQRLAQRL
jgi:hypothetical protein